MRKQQKRVLAGICALAVSASVCALMPVTAVEESDILLQAEAEDCELLPGAEVTDKVYNEPYPGYSGEGFVWAGNAGGVKITVEAPEGGMYEVTTRCWMYLDGTRPQTLVVDGEQIANMSIPNEKDWIDFSFGFFYLEAGEHTIEIGGEGSQYFILYDTVTFGYADMPDLNIDPTPSDPNATAETRALKSFLTQNYGKQIISGQQEIYGGGHDGDTEYEFEYLHDTTGKYPALRGFDLMNYNPLYGWEDGTTDRAIAWAKERGGIITSSWHINVPIDFDNYEVGDTVDWQDCSYKNYQASGSTFNTENVLTEGTKEREYFNAAVEMLAEQLLKMQDAGVPIILRPLHEAQGNYGRYGDGTSWFWWGDRGPEVYKQLWRLLYTKLTEEFGVHNVIWELNLYELDNSMEWYPGDEYVDMVAYDKYENSPGSWGTSPATSVFLTLVRDTADTKMVSLAETDRIPAIDGMVKEGAWWSYICPWYDDPQLNVLGEALNPKDLLTEFYNSDYVLTLDEMPEDLYTAVPDPGSTTTTNDTNETTTTTTESTTASTESTTTSTVLSEDTTTSAPPAATLLGDVNADGEVSIADAVQLARLTSNDPDVDITDQGKANADVDQNTLCDNEDLMKLLQALANLITL